MITAAQIHREFRTALNEAAIKVTETPKLYDEEYASTLEKFGLHNTSTYKKGVEQMKTQAEIEQANKVNKSILEIQAKYPQYKLIGFKQVMEICEKYNLYMGNMTKFTGVFPKENLMELDKYSEDINHGEGKSYPWVIDNPKEKKIKYHAMDILTLVEKMNNRENGFVNYLPYYIVAPRQEFPKTLTEVGNCLIDLEKPKFQLKMSEITMVEDPIILYPIFIGATLFFHIVTAWGEEANDDMIVNKVKIETNNN